MQYNRLGWGIPLSWLDIRMSTSNTIPDAIVSIAVGITTQSFSTIGSYITRSSLSSQFPKNGTYISDRPRLQREGRIIDIRAQSWREGGLGKLVICGIQQRLWEGGCRHCQGGPKSEGLKVTARVLS